MAKTEYSQACKDCGSRNNLKFFKNQNGILTSKCVTPDCKYNTRFNNKAPEQLTNSTYNPNQNNQLILDGRYEDLTDRGISEEICRMYLYQVGEEFNQKVHIDNCFNEDGEIRSQHVRFLNSKGFVWKGSSAGLPLFGWNVIKSEFKHTLIITEGQIDALSIAMLFKREMKYSLGKQVYSIRKGAGGQTLQEIQDNLERIEEFDKVILAFDSDKPGQQAAEQVAKLISPGKVFIAKLRYKDANEFIKKDEYEELLEDLCNSVRYVPKSIRKPSLEQLRVPEPFGRKISPPGLNEAIRGIKPGRLYMVMAGAKAGKSSITKSWIKELLDGDPSLNVGLAYLEEPLETTAQSFIALDNKLPLYKISEKPESITIEEYKNSYDKYVNSDRIQYLDASFMELTGVELIHDLEFLIKGFKCEVVVLDHITMITYDSMGEQSERKDIDILMKNLRRLANRSKCAIICVCHLKRPQTGKSWAEGREITPTDARGSAAFEQLCDVMIGLERNQMDEQESKKTKVKVIANRVTGKTGYVEDLYFDEDLGRNILLSDMFKGGL